jgi:RNase P/RNase MRP subunit p29
MPNNIDAAEDWLDSWAASANAQAERAVALSRRVAALTGSAQSPDGSIRVTVGSSGQLESLELDDRELADRILSVMRSAQTNLAGQVATETQDTVGADSETGRAVIHSFESRFAVRNPDDDLEGETNDGR